VIFITPARITLGILIPEIHKVKGEEKKTDCHDVSVSTVMATFPCGGVT